MANSVRASLSALEGSVNSAIWKSWPACSSQAATPEPGTRSSRWQSVTQRSGDSSLVEVSGAVSCAVWHAVESGVEASAGDVMSAPPWPGWPSVLLPG